MGVQGLRKLIDASGCARQLDARPPAELAQQDLASGGGAAAAAAAAAAAEENSNRGGDALVVADHVLVDMNAIVHQSYSRTHPDARTTIQCVLQTLRRLFGSMLRARRTLVMCFDGPAPVAKLVTQRLRRRKVAHLDIANSANFSDLSITTGSSFMLELEQHVTHFIKNNSERSFGNNNSNEQPLFARTDNVSVSGSSVPGEGEAKIASALGRIAATSAKSENDSVIIVGNDIDLVLTCVGATSFHNIGVLNPQTMQIIDVGSFIARWLLINSAAPAAAAAAASKANQKNNGKKGAAAGAAGNSRDDADEADADGDGALGGLSNSNSIGFVSFAQLPGARVDFVYLFMLNGSDYYDGLGDVALSLWKRYKMLKRERPEFRLVSKNHQLIVQSLRALFQCEQIAASTGSGKKVGGKRRGRGAAGKEVKRGGDDGSYDDDDDSDFDDEKPDKNGGGGGGAGGAGRVRAADFITPEQRKSAMGLLQASLWSLIGTISGVCPNFRFRPLDPKHTADAAYVTSATLRSVISGLEHETLVFKVPTRVAVQPKNNSNRKRKSGADDDADGGEQQDEQDDVFGPQQQFGNEEDDGEEFGEQHEEEEQSQRQYRIVLRQHSHAHLALQQTSGTQIHPDDPGAPLTPLQTFCALMPRLELLPKPVEAVLNKHPTLADKWHAGGTELLGAMRRLFSLVDVNALTPAERFLTQFGDPVDVKGGFYRGHPVHGVARMDQHGNRKFSIDFFRFTYAGNAAASAKTKTSNNDNNRAEFVDDAAELAATGAAGPVRSASAGKKKQQQQRPTAAKIVVVPVVASDLVPGAARMNETVRQIKLAEKEQAKARERAAKAAVRRQLRALEETVQRDLKRSKKLRKALRRCAAAESADAAAAAAAVSSSSAATETRGVVSFDDNGGSTSSADAAGNDHKARNRNRHEAAAAKLSAKMAKAEALRKTLMKRKAVTPQPERGKPIARAKKLYWHDVFSAESKKKVT